MKNAVLLIVIIFGLTACKTESDPVKSGEQDNKTTVKDTQKNYSGTALIMIDSFREYKTGAKVNLADNFKLTQGREIDFYMTNGATIALKGPTEGILGALLETDSEAEQWAKIGMDVLNKKANEGHVMTVRSGGEKTVWMANAVPVPFSETFCIQTGTLARLYRKGESSSSLEIDITHDDSTRTLVIPAGVNSVIDWPEGFPELGTFSLSNKAWDPSPNFTIKAVDFANIVSLIENGCTYHLSNMKMILGN